MIIRADARSLPLRDECVQCVVTSPPYWGLRSYGRSTALVWGGSKSCPHEWRACGRARRAGNPNGGLALTGTGAPQTRLPGLERRVAGGGNSGAFCESCGAWRGELGQETNPESYVSHLVEIGAEIWRVLRSDGTLWLNLGDCYMYRGSPEYGSSDGGVRRRGTGGRQAMPEHLGLKAKDLVGIPWMAAFALRRFGWYLRSDVVWHKRNCVPESTRDRPTRSHEEVFLLSKSPRYHYDAEAVREPLAEASVRRLMQKSFASQRGGAKDYGAATGEHGALNPNRSARRTVENLRARVLAASGSEAPGRNCRDVWEIVTEPLAESHYAAFPQALAARCILAGSRPGDLVLDPFLGSGTTGMAAERLGRRWVGVELSAEYCRLARRRTAQIGLPIGPARGGIGASRT